MGFPVVCIWVLFHGYLNEDKTPTVDSFAKLRKKTYFGIHKETNPTSPTPIASPKRQPQERDHGRKKVTTYHMRDPQGKVLAVIFPIYRRRGNFPLT